MSEEEKKAIEYLENEIKQNKYAIHKIESNNDSLGTTGYGTMHDVYKIKNCAYLIVLNLIEKQQKEIEKMKSLDIYKLVEDWETGQIIPVQKIKDIIDRIDYDIKKTKEIISKNTNIYATYQKNDYQIVRLRAMNTKSLDIKKRLQELLKGRE